MLSLKMLTWPNIDIKVIIILYFRRMADQGMKVMKVRSAGIYGYNDYYNSIFRNKS